MQSCRSECEGPTVAQAASSRPSNAFKTQEAGIPTCVLQQRCCSAQGESATKRQEHSSGASCRTLASSDTSHKRPSLAACAKQAPPPKTSSRLTKLSSGGRLFKQDGITGWTTPFTQGYTFLFENPSYKRVHSFRSLLSLLRQATHQPPVSACTSSQQTQRLLL
jgi:hypothetical protein